MEQLKDKIKQYKSVAIGLGVATVGFTFDYGIVDDIMILGGGFTVGWYISDIINLSDIINYIRYSLRKDKPTEYRE